MIIAYRNIMHEVEFYRVSQEDIDTLLTKLMLGINFQVINQKKVKVPKQLFTDGLVNIKPGVKVGERYLVLTRKDNQIVLTPQLLKVETSITGRWKPSTVILDNLPKG